MPRVTMADVARTAGVSKQTVSRVINAKGDTSQATIQKVMAAVNQLHYTPNSIARSLVTRQSRTLGLILPSLGNPFYAEVAEGAETAAWEQRYSMFVSNAFRDAAHEEVALGSFEQHSVDGVILTKPRMPEARMLQLLERQRAAVVIERSVPTRMAGSIRIDYAHGVRLAVQHLAGGGRRRIGFFSGRLRSEAGKARYQGFVTAMAEVGLEVDEALVVRCETTVEATTEAARVLLGTRPDVEGIVCFSDVVAIGVLHACGALGVRIPDDIAVVGHGNIAIASLITPKLTTLHVDRFGIGANAVRMLLDRIEGRNLHAQVTIIPELVVRDSAP